MTQQTSFVLGLIGAGISASLTPAMQEREGSACGLNLTYRRIDAGIQRFTSVDLPEVLDWAARLGFDGLNITHPFKQAVIPLLDELTDDAHDLGAVNTVLLRDGALIGTNTDWSGYGQAFRRVLPEAVHDRAVLVGAGGAGSAVGYALLQQGAAHVSVVDVERERADSCVTRLAKVFGDERVEVATDVAAALADAHGLVNATPIGMLGKEGMPIAADLLRPDLWVSDVVYFPLETELIERARELGCRVLPGGGMAVFQAADAFAHFTGRTPDADRMIRHFDELTAS
ncbi:MAG TPA: shikimate dehydrogenase [Flexivirga sp.]|uniref:shikimate dehydrogenase n=1 Tax=Flexivirga sp. TaxID=1962927 RepID=UPI002C2F4109|nr:shikimate dehydrogenase [Flexivirga sp.]HWC23629.1 shikimate dehydrogenase [Flexivirga sp.]